METIGFTNGNSHGSEEPLLAAASDLPPPPPEMNDDIRAAAEMLERVVKRVEQQCESQIQDLAQRVAANEQRGEANEQRAQQVQQEQQEAFQERQALRQELLGAQEYIRNQTQQLQTVQQHIEDLNRGGGEYVQQLAAVSGTVEAETQRRSHIEVSIGELAGSVDMLRNNDLQKLGQEVESLKDAAYRAGKRQKWHALLAAIALVIAAGVQALGWPMVKQYVAGWLPWAI